MELSFYQSKNWLAFRELVISKRLNKFGQSICEYCNKPIFKKYDLILHHITPLNELNYVDANISLNEKNIMIVHHGCHNKIHQNLIDKYNKIYIVYGPPLAGKSTFVKNNMLIGDLIIDIDNIWQCICNTDKYIKPNGLKQNVFAIRNLLLDQVKHKIGFWKNCYICGGYPLVGERERLANELDAELVFIDTDKQTCMSRINDKTKNYKQFIDEWFNRYTPPTLN